MLPSKTKKAEDKQVRYKAWKWVYGSLHSISNNTVVSSSTYLSDDVH